MSRIGRKPVEVPAGVKVSIKDRTVMVQGPGGTLNMTHRPEVSVVWDEAEKAVKVAIDASKMKDKQIVAIWGTTRALIRNMILGVTKGYEKSMEVVGVGWSPVVQGNKLKLIVGFANPKMLNIPVGLKVTVEKQFVKIQGPDKRMVGQFAADMRATRKPEPYNGKGIKYTTETIKRKAGKTFGA